MGRARGTQSNVASPARRGRGAAVDEEPAAKTSLAELYGLDAENLTDEVERRPTPNMDTGRIIVPRSQKEVNETIARWKALGPQPVAHDLECAASPTVPNGSGLHPHLGTIRLAQFGVAEGGRGLPEALVVNVWKHNPEEILEVLENPEWPTIIHFAQMETRWLGYRYGLRVENLIDTRLVASLLYQRDVELGIWRPRIIEDKLRALQDKKPSFSLGHTSKRDLGLELDKTQQTSAWDAVKLSRDQEVYAGRDVLSLLDLWEQYKSHVDWEIRQKMQEAARKLANRGQGARTRLTSTVMTTRSTRSRVASPSARFASCAPAAPPPSLSRRTRHCRTCAFTGPTAIRSRLSSRASAGASARGASKSRSRSRLPAGRSRSERASALLHQSRGGAQAAPA